MNCGHLFNGISGFGLAAHWMGWSNLMHCEIDPFCNRVMNYHFPNSFQHEDIRTTDFRIWRGKIDLVTGGFPCQPFSSAGKRKGTEDDRNLWPEMLRAIREIQPRWVVAENVYGITNWSKGLVFEQVQNEMENEGYQVGAYLLPACGVEAPHERTRTWFVAYSDHFNRGPGAGRQNGQEVDYGRQGIIADTGRRRQPRQGRAQQPCYKKEDRNWKANWSHDDDRWPTVTPFCKRNDGFPNGLVNLTFSKWRQEALKAMGNAVVPEVAYQIFKAIEQYENL